MTTAKEIIKRLEALEARFDQHDHAHDMASLLRNAPKKRINARLAEIEARLEDQSVSIHGFSEELDGLTCRVAALEGAPPRDDAASTTGPIKRWVIVIDGGGRVFDPWSGFCPRGSWFPIMFDTAEDAALVRGKLFAQGSAVDLEEVEVVERDGRLVEARYA